MQGGPKQKNSYNCYWENAHRSPQWMLAACFTEASVLQIHGEGRNQSYGNQD